jgi:hypothetical protein
MIPTPEIFRSLDTNGDWVFGQGTGSYLTGEQAIALDLKTALFCFLNDAFWQLDFGIDWVTYLGAKGTENAILLACRQMIASRPNIVAITALSATLNAVTRSLTLVYNVATTFSRSLIGSVQFTLPNT